jgi:uncharacterized integral membrane protein
MYLRTILILLALGGLAIFTGLNWDAITTPTSLSLIFITAEAPLGLILLGVVVLLAALFIVYIAYLQSSMLFESRRQARELQAQRELAEQAESSRYHELRSFLENELQGLTEHVQESKTELAERMDRLERELRSAIEQCESSLTAYLAEIDDRLERAAADPSPRKPAG